MKKNIRKVLSSLSILFIFCPLFLVNNASAESPSSGEEISLVPKYQTEGIESSQAQKSIGQLSLEEGFYWDRAWLNPGPTVYVSSTPIIYYEISFHNALVGDSFTWRVYWPVLDPETYMPTGELEYCGSGTYTRIDEEYWRYQSGITSYSFYGPSGNGVFGAGPRIKDAAGTAHPGIWQITISHNDGLLTSTNFMLIDDLAPTVSFISPTDGTALKGIKYLMVSNSDNLKVTKVELYADNVITGQSYLLATRDNPTPAFAYFWDTSAYPDGDYVLRALAYDPYDNVGTGRTAVIVGNKAAPDKQVPINKITQVGEPINVANGNMSMAQTDILIPFKEVPLELSRTYNSQDDFSGAFGYGWRSNFDISLSEQLDQSVIEVDGDGVYTIYISNGNGEYTPSAGKHSQLTKSPDGTFVLLRKHGRKLYFTSTGGLIKIEERNGNQLNITRAANGAISEVSDSAGRKLSITSNAQGKITQVTDPLGRVFKYQYDAQGNLIKTIDPLRKETLYQYDGQHNLIRKTDPNGNSLYFEYDASDRAYHSWQDGVNNEVTLNFNWAGKTTKVTDSLGRITGYEYDHYGLVSKITDAQGNIELATWDASFNKTSTIDKSGNTTNFQYDPRGNLLSATDPQGNITVFTYEPNFDFVSSAIDALGGRNVYSYDAKGNLVQLTDAVGNVTGYTYDATGQLIQTKDANNSATDFIRDAYGNPTRITDAMNNQRDFTYNAIGKVIKETDAKGSATTFSYDLLGRLTQTTYVDGSSTVSAYDAAGNLLSFTDQLRRATDYTYDAVNRLIQKTDALGNTITNAYDTEGNLTSVTDANSQSTQYSYDSLNKLVETIDPLGNRTLYDYDANGNLVSTADAKNNTTTYLYDTNNRLIQTNYPDSSAVSLAYDVLGRKVSMTGSSGTTAYSYDALGRLTGVDGPQTSDTISYSYDRVGNRIQMINPDGRITNYVYDALNLLKTLTDDQGRATTYTFDAVGNLIQANYPNNTQAVYTFDSLNRLISLSNKSGTTIISFYSYIYNAAGMRTRTTLSNGDYILYTYDKVNCLTSEQKYNKSKKLLYDISYTYDVCGNRLTEDIDVRDASFRVYDFPLKSSLAYTYNAANQLTNLKVYVVSKGKTTVVKNTSYSYDSNGNLIQQNINQAITDYTYDFENRLISALGPSVNANYNYDADGKRIRQTESGLVTKFLYDGGDVILERDDSNQKRASYTRGLNYAGGIGGIISSYSASGASSQYLYDGSGSVTSITDSSGQASQTYTYDAFGNILQQGGAGTNPYQFQTKHTSPTTGLVYFGARYYNPLIGRFITQDPSGMVDGPNLYLYVNNNPVNLIDPWGLCKKKKDKPWWPKWSEKYIPNYGVYGGPIRADPTFKTKPVDSMDELFMEHDFLWGQGMGKAADTILFLNLINLPNNPNSWEKKPSNNIWAIVYREGAIEYFWVEYALIKENN